jgi:hypothetical protein
MVYLSTLALLVARVLAQDPNDALAAHDLALVTDFLDAGSNLHRDLVFLNSTLGESCFDPASGRVDWRNFDEDWVARDDANDGLLRHSGQ